MCPGIRFAIYVDFHSAGWAANINEIHCNPLVRVRMLKMEKSGATKEAWSIRKEYLDRLLSMLDYPNNENSSGMTRFEDLHEAVAEASKIYRNSQRPAFLRWLEGAVSKIRANAHIRRLTVEDSETVSQWSAKLESLAR